VEGIRVVGGMRGRMRSLRLDIEDSGGSVVVGVVEFEKGGHGLLQEHGDGEWAESEVRARDKTNECSEGEMR
jgi:hypothetical protein